VALPTSSACGLRPSGRCVTRTSARSGIQLPPRRSFALLAFLVVIGVAET